MGTCDPCLGRLGGKRPSSKATSIRSRNQRIDSEGNQRLLNIRQEIPCPFCENLFEEVDSADVIEDA